MKLNILLIGDIIKKGNNFLDKYNFKNKLLSVLEEKKLKKRNLLRSNLRKNRENFNKEKKNILGRLIYENKISNIDLSKGKFNNKHILDNSIISIKYNISNDVTLNPHNEDIKIFSNKLSEQLKNHYDAILSRKILEKENIYEGKILIKVFIKTLAGSSQVSVKIIDNGIGCLKNESFKNTNFFYGGLGVGIKSIILGDNFTSFKLRKGKNGGAISIMKMIFL